MRKLLGILIVGAILFQVSNVFGMGMIDLTGMGPYIAKISNKSINRIALPYPPKDLIVQKDAPLEVKLMGNNLFVSVLRADYTGSIDLYLIFEGHDPIGLTLIPAAISGETIVLISPGADREKAAKWEKAVPYEKTIKELVRKIAMDEIPSGYSVEEGTNKNLSPWKEASIQLQRSFKGSSLTGEVYSVVNVSGELLTFDEDELEEGLFGKNVKAVAIQNRKLDPGQQTLVYVVRANSKEESGGR